MSAAERTAGAAGEPGPTRPACWVLSDGAAGNEKQGQALAAALGLTAQCLRLDWHWPWPWLAPRWTPPLSAYHGASLGPPWPDLAIGVGRLGAAALRTLRRASQGRTITVQILDPRIDPKHFDLVIVPEHDALSGSQVISIRGSVHGIDAAWLARMRAAHPLPSAWQAAPRTVLLVGGPHRSLPLQPEDLAQLVASVRRWQAQGGSLIVIGSRRTPASWRQQLAPLREIAATLWFTPEDGDNPYAAALAWADRLIVTPDSVNMLSEAAATGLPLYAPLPRPARGRFGRFHQSLIEAGRLHRLDAPDAVSALPPHNPLQAALPRIRALLIERGLRLD